jgi:hypothetical protein
MNTTQAQPINEKITPTADTPPTQPQVNLTDVQIINENVSLNVIVGFLNLAQKRGSFNVQESSKIWECIKMFQKPTGPQGPESL